MNNTARLTGLLLSIALLLTSLPSRAEEVGVPYTRIYTDTQGESHFEEAYLPLETFELMTGNEGGVYGFTPGSTATFLALEPGAFEDFHPSPEPQFLVVIKGISEVGVTDGEVRQFGPGSLILMEDTGTGHTTATVGDQNHIGLMIPIIND